MKKITTIILLIVSTLSYGQRSVHFADSIRQTHHIPEMSYAVVNSKSILELAALGKHAVNLPDTASLNDRFHIGSNTKAMTAFMIAKYVEKGQLKWTTKFFDLFPEWKKGSNPGYATITLQDLLSHTALIPPFQGENDPEIPDFKGSNPEKRKQFGRFVLTLEPEKLDSQNTFVYSNAGYTLATLMLEKVTRSTWEKLINKVFNQDLNLDVKLSWPENQKIKGTWGHLTENDSLKPVPSTWDYHLDYTEPAGDLNIKLQDFVRFVQLNLQGLEGRNNYLKSDTYKFIHNGFKNYALGWFNVYENGKVLSVHSGTGAFTYFTLVHIDRINNRAFIIFTNSFNQQTQQGVRLLMRKLKETYGS